MTKQYELVCKAEISRFARSETSTPGMLSCLRCLIIPTIVQTIRQDRPGADQIDREHQPTDLVLMEVGAPGRWV